MDVVEGLGQKNRAEPALPCTHGDGRLEHHLCRGAKHAQGAPSFTSAPRNGPSTHKAEIRGEDRRGKERAVWRFFMMEQYKARRWY